MANITKRKTSSSQNWYKQNSTNLDLYSANIVDLSKIVRCSTRGLIIFENRLESANCDIDIGNCSIKHIDKDAQSFLNCVGEKLKEASLDQLENNNLVRKLRNKINERLKQNDLSQFTFSFYRSDETNVHAHVQISVINDTIAVLLHDVTDIQEEKNNLEKQHWELMDAYDHLELHASELANLAQELEFTKIALTQEMERSKQLESQLRNLASTDSLTNIANRRCFMERAAMDIECAHQQETPLSLLMMDIDWFKSVNDTHGHGVGDDVICFIAEVLTVMTEGRGFLPGRLGGEEFALLMPQTKLEEAAEFAEQIRKQIADYDLFIEEIDCHLDITISIGVSELSDIEEDIAPFLARADQALYEAKHAGRNQVKCAH